MFGVKNTTYTILIVISLCCCLQLPTQANAARILGFFPSPSKSHILINCAIADTLQQAGHNVTVITAFPNIYKNAKYNYIQLDTPTFDVSFVNDSLNNPKPFYSHFTNMANIMSSIGNASILHPITQKILRENGPGSFDLVILGNFMNDFHMGVAAHFKCPVIITSMTQPIFGMNELVGSPDETAYVPLLFGGLLQPMNFRARVKNFIVSFVEKTIVRSKFNKKSQELYAEHFPADRYPSLEEMKKNVSLVFVNHHFSQGPIRPQVPALIEIGGIQIKEKPDPLPENIQKVLDNAKNGAIYFSLGSNVQGSILSPEKAKIMFNVLSKLPQKVLWKWGDSDFPGTSDNILYQSWLPQDDILAHPNVKLFITHGGQGSVVESQYHGVPMVGIPLFGDQPANMANVERSGFGLPVSYIDLTEESFSKAISEVLNNPKYSEAVKTFSRIYRDRPMTARQTVVYWVDYVLRYHGAKHLQSPAVFMNKWQLMSLDVIAFLIVVLTLVISIIVVICKLICCRGRKATKKVTKAKKNK